MEQTDRLGEVLVEVGVITQEQLNEAIEARRVGTVGGDLREILITAGFATEAQIIKGIGMKDQIAYFEDLDPFLTPESAKFLPEKYCRQYQVVPLFQEGDHLMLAMLNPYDVAACDQIGSQTGLSVQPVISTRNAVLAAITKMFRPDEAAELHSTISKATEEVRQAGATDEDKEYTTFEVSTPTDVVDPNLEVLDDAPVIKLVNQILLGAINKRASDIHIEPRADKLIVRYRMDGVLSEIMSLPRALAPTVASRIKIIAKLDIAETRKPQDGRIRMKLTDRNVDLRVSSLPLVTGEKVVMRILDKDESQQDIDKIGMPPEILTPFKQLLQSPNGIILVTGPTGSGKTTTLYAALQSIKDDTVNISTLEDPVEYQVAGINQVTLNAAIGMTFAAALRSLLRQDPDVLLVGEIRDQETAEISIHAALTGHLVFSTLHTNSACGSISRLMDMGIEPFLLSSSLKGIIAQRLIRLLCPYCRKPYEPDAAQVERLGLPPPSEPYTFYRPTGCDKCSKTGYRRRVGVFELLVINRDIQDKIQARAPDNEIMEAARGVGFHTMYENGMMKVLNGDTSCEELLRVVAG